jgi:4-hydroxybenzoate polyprenyltransferase
MKDTLLLLRIHIVLIAVMGTMVFGWLITDRYLYGVALVVGLDWLLINLMNRLSDIPEDLANRIPATEKIQNRRHAIIAVFAVVFAGSLLFTWFWRPELTGWRLFMQATGMVYNFRLLPMPGGRRRLKEVYFFKNFMSALGFVTTCFFYPLATIGYQPLIGWVAVLALIFYFMPFELTYEILYDLRDVEGDRAIHVPTYPVVHGTAITHRIIHGLLLGSVGLLGAAFLAGAIGVRELLMAQGPVIHYLVMRPMLRRGPDTSDCIRITNLGWGLLALYLLCTALWIASGLPANIFLWKSVVSA